jgi:hypothetical protein
LPHGSFAAFKNELRSLMSKAAKVQPPIVTDDTQTGISTGADLVFHLCFICVDLWLKLCALGRLRPLFQNVPRLALQMFA